MGAKETALLTLTCYQYGICCDNACMAHGADSGEMGLRIHLVAPELGGKMYVFKFYFASFLTVANVEAIYSSFHNRQVNFDSYSSHRKRTTYEGKEL